MNITEYLRQLERQKTLAVNRFGTLTIIETQVVEAAFDWLLDNLNISRGTPEQDADLARSMDNFVGAVVQIINDNRRYQSTVTSFLSDLNGIKTTLKEFHATSNRFNIDKAGVNDVQKLLVEEAINQFLGNGLNSHFAAPLRDSVFRNMLAGANMKEVKQVLREYIIGGQDESGKLGSYLTQTAQQAVDSYTGITNQQLVKTYKFTGYVISGSIIATSSTQCIYAINHSKAGYLPYSEWEKVLAIAKINKRAPLIEGTNLKNLPLNKLHWGCRHEFTPTIKS